MSLCLFAGFIKLALFREAPFPKPPDYSAARHGIFPISRDLLRHLCLAMHDVILPNGREVNALSSLTSL
jgi:hypothetical protein